MITDMTVTRRNGAVLRKRQASPRNTTANVWRFYLRFFELNWGFFPLAMSFQLNMIMDFQQSASLWEPAPCGIMRRAPLLE